MIVMYGFQITQVQMENEIKLVVPDDYCQGNAKEYVFQSPPEDKKTKGKVKSVKVKRAT